MMIVADFLVKGLGIQPLIEYELKKIEGGSRCLLSGQYITEGYSVWDIIPSSTGEFLDFLPGGMVGYLSETVARAIKGTWNLGSRVIFEDGTHYHPLIARDQKKERPCWSELVRQIWKERAGQKVLIILATDPKKRIWNRARIGVLGSTTPVLLFDTDNCLLATKLMDWVELLRILDIIEEVYTLGFSKRGIQQSLLSEWSRVQKYGIKKVIEIDNLLKTLRAKAEFTMALLIAQKGEEIK